MGAETNRGCHCQPCSTSLCAFGGDRVAAARQLAAEPWQRTGERSAGREESWVRKRWDRASGCS